MADAETTWVLRRFASRPNQGEDHSDHAPSIDEAVLRYQSVWAVVDSTVAAAPNLDVECPAFDDQPVVNLRWILAHLLQETARHAGHADILRELIDGVIGR
jgi:hypothetical protein